MTPSRPLPPITLRVAFWITNGSIADVAVVWAKLDGVINGFLVEKETKGFSTF